MPKIHKDREPTDRTQVADEAVQRELTTEVAPKAAPKRKPGRPKGSRSKPKPNVVTANAQPAAGRGESGL